jgi:competence ComEA-like helix-hairpin-helix protein
MFDFTPEEKKVTLFILSLAFCGLTLSGLIKANCRAQGLVYPQANLVKLDLNRVSLGELAKIRCIPVKLAARIIEYRDFRKVFNSLEELKEVKGIGPQRYDKLKELFFVE